MTIREASKKIGVSCSKLYQLVAARQIAHYRVGGKILFSEEDIASFLQACRVATTIQQKPQPPPFKLKHISLNGGNRA